MKVSLSILIFIFATTTSTKPQLLSAKSVFLNLVPNTYLYIFYSHEISDNRASLLMDNLTHAISFENSIPTTLSNLASPQFACDRNISLCKNSTKHLKSVPRFFNYTNSIYIFYYGNEKYFDNLTLNVLPALTFNFAIDLLVYISDQEFQNFKVNPINILIITNSSFSTLHFFCNYQSQVKSIKSSISQSEAIDTIRFKRTPPLKSNCHYVTQLGGALAGEYNANSFSRAKSIKFGFNGTSYNILNLLVTDANLTVQNINGLNGAVNSSAELRQNGHPLDLIGKRGNIMQDIQSLQILFIGPVEYVNNITEHVHLELKNRHVFIVLIVASLLFTGFFVFILLKTPATISRIVETVTSVVYPPIFNLGVGNLDGELNTSASRVAVLFWLFICQLLIQFYNADLLGGVLKPIEKPRPQNFLQLFLAKRVFFTYPDVLSIDGTSPEGCKFVRASQVQKCFYYLKMNHPRPEYTAISAQLQNCETYELNLFRVPLRIIERNEFMITDHFKSVGILNFVNKHGGSFKSFYRSKETIKSPLYYYAPFDIVSSRVVRLLSVLVENGWFAVNLAFEAKRRALWIENFLKQTRIENVTSTKDSLELTIRALSFTSFQSFFLFYIFVLILPSLAFVLECLGTSFRNRNRLFHRISDMIYVVSIQLLTRATKSIRYLKQEIRQRSPIK